MLLRCFSAGATGLAAVLGFGLASEEASRPQRSANVNRLKNIFTGLDLSVSDML